MQTETRWLRSLSLKRRRPKTRLGVVVRYVERTLLVLAVLYGALHIYPEVLFAHSFSERGITVYARSEPPPQIADRVVEIAELVSRSELTQADGRHRIFVCNNPWLFRFYAPRHGRSFAVSVWLTGNIFVAEADLKSNVARSRGADFNERSFSGVAAHEITHGLIRSRLGLLRELRTEAWLKEGYADYIAQESSFPEDEGLHLAISGGSHPSRAFQYFLWRKMIEHLVERRGSSFEELLALAGDADRVEQETVAALRSQWSGR